MLIKYSDYLSIDDGIDVSKMFAVNPLPLESKSSVLQLPEQSTWLPPLESIRKYLFKA